MASHHGPDHPLSGLPLVYAGPPHAGSVVREHPGSRCWTVRWAGPHPEDDTRTAVVLCGELGELRRDAPHRHPWRQAAPPEDRGGPPTR